MTTENKYQKWYDNLIARARSRTLVGYTERHHVIPKSLGGTDDKLNLVTLTAREHLIAHLLLTKCYEGQAKSKMLYGLWKMLCQQNQYQQRVLLNSRMYEHVRNEYIIHLKSRMTGKRRPEHSRALAGRKQTPEQIAAAIVGRQKAAAERGYWHSPATIQKMKQAHAKPKSEAWKRAASLKRKDR